MADGRDVHHIRVRRMNDDAADVARVGEAGQLPRAAGIGRLVDAVAPRRALAIVGFAGSGPDDVGVRRRHGDVANRHHRVDAIEHRRPRRALVDAPEDAAAGGRDVDGVGLTRHARDRDVVDAAAGRRRSDAAPAQITEDRCVDGGASVGAAKGHKDRRQNQKRADATHPGSIPTKNRDSGLGIRDSRAAGGWSEPVLPGRTQRTRSTQTKTSLCELRGPGGETGASEDRDSGLGIRDSRAAGGWSEPVLPGRTQRTRSTQTKTSLCELRGPRG